MPTPNTDPARAKTMNDMITTTDLRRWQWAAVSVLSDLIDGAPADLNPLAWKVGTTAHLVGAAPSGTRTERISWLTAWAEHLDIDLTTRATGDGMTLYQGQTERTAVNGKAVRVQLWDRIPDQD